MLMNQSKVNAIATSMIAFLTFLGVLSAFIYYFYSMNLLTTLLEVGFLAIIYIDINLLFLYILKERILK